jgi:hypothetical protein
MTQDVNWNDDAISFLQKTTRDLKFDWNAISKTVSEHFKSTDTLLDVSPLICRQQYAKDYSKRPSNISSSSTALKNPYSVVQNPSAPIIDVSKKVNNPAHSTTLVTTTNSSTILEIEEQQVVPTLNQKEYDLKHSQIFNSYNEMSLEDLIQHVNEKEVQLNTRKEQIFSSVLDSLSGFKSIESSKYYTQEMNEIKNKFLESQQEREQNKLKNALFMVEKQEKIDLENERNKLKSRFHVDSEDNKGVNPFADNMHFGGTCVMMCFVLCFIMCCVLCHFVSCAFRSFFF